MNRRDDAILLAIFVLAAFAFFVPVVYVMPPGVLHCFANGCNYPVYGSLTYWAFGVGGVWTQKGYFTIIA